MSAPDGLPVLTDVGRRVRATETPSVVDENRRHAAALASGVTCEIAADGTITGTYRGQGQARPLDVDAVRDWGRHARLGAIPNDPFGRTVFDNPATAAEITRQLVAIVRDREARRQSRERSHLPVLTKNPATARRLFRLRELLPDGDRLYWQPRERDVVRGTRGAEPEHPDQQRAPAGLLGRRRRPAAEEVTPEAVAHALRTENLQPLPGGERPDPAGVVAELRRIAGLPATPDDAGTGTGWLRTKRHP